MQHGATTCIQDRHAAGIRIIGDKDTTGMDGHRYRAGRQPHQSRTSHGATLRIEHAHRVARPVTHEGTSGLSVNGQGVRAGADTDRP